MYISNGLRLYFKFTPVRMVRHEATPKRPTIKSPLLIYFAVMFHWLAHQFHAPKLQDQAASKFC